MASTAETRREPRAAAQPPKLAKRRRARECGAPERAGAANPGAPDPGAAYPGAAEKPVAATRAPMAALRSSGAENGESAAAEGADAARRSEGISLGARRHRNRRQMLRRLDQIDARRGHRGLGHGRGDRARLDDGEGRSRARRSAAEGARRNRRRKPAQRRLDGAHRRLNRNRGRGHGGRGRRRRGPGRGRRGRNRRQRGGRAAIQALKERVGETLDRGHVGDERPRRDRLGLRWGDRRPGQIRRSHGCIRGTGRPRRPRAPQARRR